MEEKRNLGPDSRVATRPVGIDAVQEVGWEEGKSPPSPWIYESVQSIGRHQSNYLYLLLIFFVFDLILWRSTSENVTVPFFSIPVRREFVLFTIPVPILAMLISYYGAMRAMASQLGYLKAQTPFTGPLFLIDKNNTLIDYMSLSRAFTFQRVVLGWFLMPTFLLGVFLFALLQSSQLAVYCFEWRPRLGLFVLIIEIGLLVAAARVLLGLWREAQIKFLKDLRG